MQTMAIYMTALGMTMGYDGWRFEPVPFETYKLVCRGQVTPQSREVVYEVFVREIIAGPEPTLFADLLVTVDGLPAFHCGRMGLRLSPGCPMDMGLKELEGYVEPKPVAEGHGVKFDLKAMLACAVAKPSLAVGPLYEKFDTHRRVARLPGPPYHFMSRVTEVVGELGVAKAGTSVVAEYDIPSDAWYFAENKGANGKLTMPTRSSWRSPCSPAAGSAPTLVVRWTSTWTCSSATSTGRGHSTGRSRRPPGHCGSGPR